MTIRRNRPTVITDAPEHRAIPLDRVELRDDNADEYILEGYASTFEEYEMYGGPAQYGWIERIDKGAFAKTLREKPDLHLLVNHQGMPLARTKSGTCELSVDDHGLKVTARLDKRDPEAQSLAVKMERGDMDEMSFAFRVKAQEWRAAEGYEDDDQSYRTITEVSLHKGDVSVVNWGANPTTSVGIRSAADALKVLAEADDHELAEIRAEADVTNLKVAQEKLTALRTGTVLDGALTVNEVRELEGLEPVEERTCATCTCGAEEEVEDDEVEDSEVEETEDEPIVVAEDEADRGEESSEVISSEHGTITDGEIRTCECGSEWPNECTGTEEEDERAEESAGMSLRDAMAFMGEVPEEGAISLAAARALAE